MPFFIDRELNIYDKNPIIKLPEFKPSYIVSDTEFTKLSKLLVDCIGIYLPDLIHDYLVVFTYEELTPNFHPLKTVLQTFGYNIESANEESLMSVIERIQELFNKRIDCEKSSRDVKKQFKLAVNEGVFDHLLTELNIDSECLSVEKDKHSGTYAIKVCLLYTSPSPRD